MWYGAMDIITEGGTTTYTIHQSDLATWLTCPERARQLWTGEATDSTTAEAAVGTATHTAIERFIGGATPSEAVEAATAQFRGLSEQAEFRWVKLKTADTAVRHIEQCFTTWRLTIWPHVPPPIAVEQPFDFPFLDLGDVHVRLAGVIDLTDCFGEPWDWKTCSRISKYTSDAWQLRRWAIQPTVYTLACCYLGLYEGELPVPFHYGAMQRGAPISTVLTVERDRSHWSWLAKVCTDLVVLHDADLSVWPVNDQHALCSADWCPAWSTCKGAHCATARVSHVQTVGTFMATEAGA